MSVLVLGGSSQIGHFLFLRLASLGGQVRAISRSASPPATPGVAWLAGALPAAMPAMAPADAIVSFAPMDALAEWLLRAPPPAGTRVVATSSMSAESKKDSPIAVDRAVALRLREGEARLADACVRAGLPWTILRPTMIYGAGLDRNLTPIARRASTWRVFPLVPTAGGLRQPIHADDVARAVIRVLRLPAETHGVLSLGGGERLTFAAMLDRVRASLPGATLGVPVPAAVLGLAAVLRPGLRGAVDRLQLDLVADNTPLEALLAFRPRAFEPTATTWFPGRGVIGLDLPW